MKLATHFQFATAAVLLSGLVANAQAQVIFK
jgi:hypothetical protein